MRYSREYVESYKAGLQDGIELAVHAVRLVHARPGLEPNIDNQ